MTRHPASTDLALYAGGDLPVWSALRLRLHLAACKQCAAEVAALRDATRELRQSADRLPAGLDWDTLQAEMTANIRLGLSAGAIVDRPEPREIAESAPEPAGWRLAVVLASLTFVAAAGWWLRNPVNQRPAADPAAVLSEAGPDGLALQSSGAALTLLNSSDQPAVTTVTWDGGARASFVDPETGQVTIHHVSAQ